MYDYLIVGAGMFGSVCARELTDNGYRCLVIDKRNHIAGNAYTENLDGINVHKYGAHIFHTSNKKIWDYVNKFAEFNQYRHTVIANYENDIYPLPFNMFTFNKIWGVTTPNDAKKKIESQRVTENPTNLEEQSISLVGEDIYKILIKGYTEKQWGRKCKELPSSIIKRLPVRFVWNNDYYDDVYQGIPIGGYTKMFEKMLEGIEVKTDIDYFINKNHWDSLANKVIFTGKIDEYYDYKFGELEYRSLKFYTKVLNKKDFQGNSVVNYTGGDVPYTRIIEHKHFEFGEQDNTVITYEYPDDWDKTKVPYYPVNDDKNNKIYKKYKELADNDDKVVFGGRLAEYKYYDMHQVVGSALRKVDRWLN